MKRYVIVGNGIAAAGCIEGIRKTDKNTPITVISGENYPVYCRPLISYYLQGRTSLEKMQYREDTFYRNNGCEVVYGETADRIDPAEHTVLLSNGETLPYDKLLIATGRLSVSSPF